MASVIQDNELFKKFCSFDPEAEARIASSLRTLGMPFRRRLGDSLDDIQRNLILSLREKECHNPDFKITLSLNAYLATSLRNKCLTELKRITQERCLETNSRYAVREPDHLPEETKVRVRDLWESLANKCRDLLDLYMRGYTYEEIGQMIPRKDGAAQTKGTIGADLSKCKERARDLAKKLGISHQSFDRQNAFRESD